MRLNSLRIVNYKGFADSGVIQLGKNWTVIVGRNNVGKSAILEAFAFDAFSNRPHRNISQDPRLPRSPESRVELSLNVTGSELERTFLAEKLEEVIVPVPAHGRTDIVTEAFLTGALTIELTKAAANPWTARSYKQLATQNAFAPPAISITEWLIANDKDHLSEVIGYVKNLIA